MNERGAAHDALVRVVAVDQAVDRAQHRVLIAHEVGASRRELLHLRLNLLDARERLGMRLEPVRNAFRLPRRLVEPSERREHVGDARRIPVRARGVPRAERIGLQLELAAELQEEDAESLFRDLAERPRARDEDAERDEPYRPADRTRVLLRRVARGDVAGFMTQHTSELRFIIEKRQNAARDVDVAARKRERVDDGRIDHGVVPPL